MNEKVDRYYMLLHPDETFDRLGEEEFTVALRDKGFIIHNIEAVDREYQNRCNTGKNPEEIIKEAVAAVKAQKAKEYYNLLHPDETFDRLGEEELTVALRDKGFIIHNIEAVDREYQNRCNTGKNLEEIIKEAVTAVKAQKAKEYYDLLHPDETFDRLSEEELTVALRDKGFIIHNIEAVDREYQNRCNTGKNPEEIIKETVTAVKSQKANEKTEQFVPIDESKFEKIYIKAKGRIGEVFSKIKSFFNIKSNDKNTEDKKIIK